MNINIGCGYHTGKCWVNYDVTPTARIQKIPFIGKFLVKKSERFPDEVIYGDIRKKPLSKLGEANNIYCSHTLEHMCLEDMRLALKNIFMMADEVVVFPVPVAISNKNLSPPFLIFC